MMRATIVTAALTLIYAAVRWLVPEADPFRSRPPEQYWTEAGFFAIPLIGGLLGKAAKAAKGFVEKKILGKKSAPKTAAQWRPGLPAPPGYRVTGRGSRSERLELVEAGLVDGGDVFSTSTAAARTREAESLIEFARRRITEELGRATQDVTRQTGEQIARGAATSETARREKQKITIAFAIGGVLLAMTLVTVLVMATRGGRR